MPIYVLMFANLDVRGCTCTYTGLEQIMKTGQLITTQLRGVWTKARGQQSRFSDRQAVCRHDSCWPFKLKLARVLKTPQNYGKREAQYSWARITTGSRAARILPQA